MYIVVATLYINWIFKQSTESVFISSRAEKAADLKKKKTKTVKNKQKTNIQTNKRKKTGHKQW